ncbi:hypothetical protein FM106_26005 [Brachybacterium faecium]|nr:hypothetical protein FM106_26005 [Brachybacterium faecium]
MREVGLTGAEGVRSHRTQSEVHREQAAEEHQLAGEPDEGADLRRVRAADRWGGSGRGALSQGRSSHVTIMSCRQIRCAGTRRPGTSRGLRPGRTGPAYPS